MSNLEGNNKEEKRREGGEEMPEGKGEGEKNKEGAEKMEKERGEEKEGGDDPMTSLLVSELECPVCCSSMVGNIPAPLTAPAPAPECAPSPAPTTEPTPVSCVSAPAPCYTLPAAGREAPGPSPLQQRSLLLPGLLQEAGKQVPNMQVVTHSCF